MKVLKKSNINEIDLDYLLKDYKQKIDQIKGWKELDNYYKKIYLGKDFEIEIITYDFETYCIEIVEY